MRYCHCTCHTHEPMPCCCRCTFHTRIIDLLSYRSTSCMGSNALDHPLDISNMHQCPSAPVHSTHLKQCASASEHSTHDSVTCCYHCTCHTQRAMNYCCHFTCYTHASMRCCCPCASHTFQCLSAASVNIMHMNR